MYVQPAHKRKKGRRFLISGQIVTGCLLAWRSFFAPDLLECSGKGKEMRNLFELPSPQTNTNTFIYSRCDYYCYMQQIDASIAPTLGSWDVYACRVASEGRHDVRAVHERTGLFLWANYQMYVYVSVSIGCLVSI